MSIRRTIASLLDDEQKQADFQRSPEEFFAEQGMEDLPGDLIGTSFVHYSDTAPIEHGDAVAGIATHFSSVPFDADDLPEFDGTQTDPFRSLTSVDTDLSPPEAAGNGDEPVEPNPLDAATGDPHTLDDEADSDIADHTDDTHDLGDPLDESEFGMGFDDDGPTEILGEIHGGGPLDPGADDPFFDDETVTEQVVVGEVDTSVAEAVTDLTEPETSEPYESFTEGLVEEFADVDPSDLDLDDL